MIQPKMKVCSGCKKPKHIWKNHNGEKFCQSCWNSHPQKLKPQSKVSKPIPQRSTKKVAQDGLYKILRDKYIKHHPMCQANLPGCTQQATDVHHKKGRGEYLLDDMFYISVCRSCHSWIETHPEEAIALNFSQLRLDKNETI